MYIYIYIIYIYIYIYISLKKDLRTIGRSHMNTYHGGGTSQGKIIRIKRHFASLIFGILLLSIYGILAGFMINF